MKKLCILPFVNLSPRPDGLPKVCSDGMHQYVPQDINLHQDTVEDFWNSKFMKEFRLTMINGKTHPHCEWCLNVEKSNGVSKRMAMNKQYLEKYKDRISEAEKNKGHLHSRPVLWEFRFSKKCNLACLSCSPTNSTLIEKQHKKHYDKLTNFDKSMLDHALHDNTIIKKYKQNTIFLNQLWENINEIEEIELHGGEPFHDKDCLDTLEQISVKGYSKNITLKVHSNMTVLNDEIINILNSFKYVKLKASIDAYGEKNNFMRWPSDWGDIESNMQLADQKLVGEKSISGTLSLFNCTSLDELHLWQQNSFQSWFLHWHVAYLPKRLGVQLLSLEPRRIQVDKLKKVQHHSGLNKWNIDSIIPSILVDHDPDKSLVIEFVNYCKSIEKMRNQDILKIFPHLVELYDLYNKHN